jgi:hypothetical protein
VPTYTFKNAQGEVYDKFMKISEVDQYLADNPGTQKQISSPNLIGGVSMDSGRLPDGFKDRLREMSKLHPRANGIKHLI